MLNPVQNDLNYQYGGSIDHRQVHNVFKWLWRSASRNKRKFLFLACVEGPVQHQSSPSAKEYALARL